MLICFSLIVKEAVFVYVNHSQILSWNQPVLNNESFLLKETMEAFDGARTHDLQASINHKSDPLPTAPRRLIQVYRSYITYHYQPCLSKY